jgi:lysozyme
MIPSSARTKVAGLVLSAAALVGLALHEGYEPVAKPPVPGDVDTGGFGSTRREDGTPMKAGEKVPPTRALVLLLNDAAKAERAVKRCAPVPMHQYEFSAYVSLTYNIGETAFCTSTLARKLNALDYEGACKEILRWDKFQGQPLRGLTNRRQVEYRQCIGEAE